MRARTDQFGGEEQFRDCDFDVQEAVARVAAERGVSPAQVAIAWLLHQPAVTAPIVGASRPEQLDQALAAVDLRLEEPELDTLTAPYQPRPDHGFL